MSDLGLLVFWCVVLAAGLAAVVALYELGLPRTYARDLLHVGAGVWVLGWPYWDSWLVPTAIVLAAVLFVRYAPHRVIRAVSGDDERWTGVVWYVLAFAGFTAIAAFDPVPAAVALLALSLGDGLGGLVGRRFGRLRYRVRGAKAKTLEGSLVVAAGTYAGVLLATLWFDAPIPFGAGLAIAAVAAVAEAMTPRGLDNLTVPIAAWCIAMGGP